MPEEPKAVRFGALVRLAPDADDMRNRAAEALNILVDPLCWTWWQDDPGRIHAEVWPPLDVF